jgi:hypothetical protein
MWLLVARNPVGMDQAVTEQNLCCVPSPCIAMLLARQHCPGWMVEHQQAVRGRDLADAIWSGSRVGAGDDSYIKRARARYRPPGGARVKLPDAVPLRNESIPIGSQYSRWQPWSVASAVKFSLGREYEQNGAPGYSI